MKQTILNISELKNLSKEQYEALYLLSQTLNSTSQKETLIEKVVDILIEVTNAERGLFAKYDCKTFQFSLLSARTFKKEKINYLTGFCSQFYILNLLFMILCLSYYIN